jgi:hypothetical protein
MRDALTQLLYHRYPVLFAEHRLDATQSGMAWGFQHDDGWFAIVDGLACVVATHAPMAAAVQVKQKMGALRFSLRKDDAFARGACAAAERFSQTISEVSGRRGVLMVGRQGRWLKTLAPGELAGFVPVTPPVAVPGASASADDELQAASGHGALNDGAKGAEAFRQAMAHRLHPVTGACGPVDDQAEMTRDEECG